MMMRTTTRLPTLLLAVVLAGCASTRPPGTLPAPVTLAEVNRVLAGERATVYYADGTSERAYIEIGPELSTVRRRRSARTARTVPTAELAQVEIDDSLSRGEGAARGAARGAVPGLVVAGASLAAGAGCEQQACLGVGLLFVGGAAAAIVGTGAGAVLGSVSASERYPVTVYRAPITRYPDAVPTANGSTTPPER